LSRDIVLIRDMFKIRHPLSGIVTAALYLTGRYTHILVVSVDLPNMSTSFLEYLISFVDSNVDCVVPRWRSGYIEPLIAVYRIDPILEFVKHNPPYKWNRVPVRLLVSYLRRIIFVQAESIVEKFGNVFLNLNTLNEVKTQLECI